MSSDASINSLIGREYQPDKFPGDGGVEKVTDLQPNTTEKVVNIIEVPNGNEKGTNLKEVVNTIGNIQKTSVETTIATESNKGPTKYFKDTPVDPTSAPYHQEADRTEADFIEGQMEEAARGSR